MPLLCLSRLHQTKEDLVTILADSSSREELLAKLISPEVKFHLLVLHRIIKIETELDMSTNLMNVSVRSTILDVFPYILISGFR